MLLLWYMFISVKSVQGNTMGQIFVNNFEFMHFIPMQNKSKAGYINIEGHTCSTCILGKVILGSGYHTYNSCIYSLRLYDYWYCCTACTACTSTTAAVRQSWWNCLHMHMCTHVYVWYNNIVYLLRMYTGCPSQRKRQLDVNYYVCDNIYWTWTSIMIMYIRLIMVCM